MCLVKWKSNSSLFVNTKTKILRLSKRTIGNKGRPASVKNKERKWGNARWVDMSDLYLRAISPACCGLKVRQIGSVIRSEIGREAACQVPKS